MTINENLTEFAGKPVEDWLPDAKSVDPATTHYRIRLEYDDFEGDQKWVDRLSSYLSQPKAEQTTGLVVGMWGADYEDGTNNADQVIEAIAAARNKLPNLKVLFLGDITYEESEISWIKQGRISPLFDAYPDLETLVVRGGDELKVGAVRHHKLKRFIIQSGGLDREIVQDAIMADFPELEHFELWLGSRNYGGNTTPEDFAPLLSGEQFPKLTYLGLCDSEFTDDLAGVLANAPVLR